MIRKLRLAQDEATLQQANDSLALDWAPSVRSFDSDGHLHIERANISRATVNPYLGKEIPETGGKVLEPNRIYKLLRDPDALRDAAKTFAGKPILVEHTPVNAVDHPHRKVVGAIGTDVQFNAPHLTAPLTIWDREAIDLIESGRQRALSCGYRYVPVWEPGVFDGEAYDGKMTAIEANHLALVEAGRAGPSVIIGDSKLEEHLTMAAMVLSRKATLAHGFMLGFIQPLLAKDKAMPDLTPAFAGVTAANFKDSKPKIAGALAEKLRGKLAEDKSLDEIPKLLAALDAMNPAEAPKPKAKDAEGEGEETNVTEADVEAAYEQGYEDGLDDGEEKADTAKEHAEGTATDKRIAARDKIRGARDKKAKDAKGKGGKDETDPDKKKDDDDKKANDAVITQQALDSAVQSGVKLAEKNITNRMKEAREAERFVRPWVGELAIAYDSAEEIYRATAEMLEVPDAKTIHVSALKSIISMAPKPGERAGVVKLASDSAAKLAAGASELLKIAPNARMPKQL